jgi:hypothetical protein
MGKLENKMKAPFKGSALGAKHPLQGRHPERKRAV